MQPTDVYEIKSVVQKPKTKCSERFDSLSTKLVQKTIEEIAIPLEHIINQSFVTGIVPDNLKIAKIIPVFKAGNSKIFTNNRPISILPTLSKIMEKIVCNRLVIYLYKHQYGFRSIHSTVHHTICVFFHYINKAVCSRHQYTLHPTTALDGATVR